MRVDDAIIEDRLGRLISDHPVNTRMRWAFCLMYMLPFLFGVFTLSVLVLTPEIYRWGIGARRFLSVGAILLVGGLATLSLGLGLASVKVARALQGGWSETFEVRSRGLVRRSRGFVRHEWRIRYWTWEDVRVLMAQYPYKQTPGLDRIVNCSAYFADDSRVHIDRHARDAQRLVRRIASHCKHAKNSTLPPSRARVFGAWFMLVAFTAALAGVLWILGTNDRSLPFDVELKLAAGALIAIIGAVTGWVLIPGRDDPKRESRRRS